MNIIFTAGLIASIVVSMDLSAESQGADEPIYPIYTLDIIEVTGKGKIISVSGRSEIRKYLEQDHPAEAIIGSDISHDTILLVYSNSAVSISFSDGEIIEFGSAPKPREVIFKDKNLGNV